MTELNKAVNNIFASDPVPTTTGVLLTINGLNASILEPNGNTLAVVLLNDSFRVGQTVLCSNQIVQRVISANKPVKTIKV